MLSSYSNNKQLYIFIFIFVFYTGIAYLKLYSIFYFFIFPKVLNVKLPFKSGIRYIFRLAKFDLQITNFNARSTGGALCLDLSLASVPILYRPW